MPTPETLELHLAAAPADVAVVVAAIAGAARDLAAVIARGGIVHDLARTLGANAAGDGQKALDVIADEAFAAALAATPVRWLASEELAQVEVLDPDGTLAVAIDPLDGSSNIDVNVSIGTIFSIYPAKAHGEESFLRPGREQAAAGYVIYGPQTALALTLGAGVALFVLDPDAGTFVRLGETREIPERTAEFAINASNYRHWPKPVRAFIDDCLAGEDGPRGENFNMRWIASLVAEVHRVLMRGGIFLYPGDRRRGYERGRLRMVYEGAPIALLVEQAGGKATDGADRILDQVPASLHARTPLVFGSAESVDRVSVYFDLPESEVSPLFGQRGLFRA